MTSGTTLVVCLLVPVTWAPPGTDLARWRAALAEDVVDLLAPLPMIHPAIAATPEDLALAKSIAWPSMPILEVDRATPLAALKAAEAYARSTAEGVGREADRAADDGLGGDAGTSPDDGWVLADGVAEAAAADGVTEAAAGVAEAVAEAAAADGGAGPIERVAVVMADAPDLPALVIGKLLRPLTTRAVAIAPALDGGLLGMATRLPVPGWLADLDPESGTVVQARATAPEPGEVVATPAWHRMRGPGDLGRLDPGLDGWETTRALLSS
jgi:hypothetical protein